MNENVSEELLVAHERERERVEGEVEDARVVLEKLGRYFEVVEEMRELEVSFVRDLGGEVLGSFLLTVFLLWFGVDVCLGFGVGSFEVDGEDYER